MFHSKYEIASGYVMLFPLNPNHTPIISQLYHRFGSYTTIFYGYTTMLMVKFIFFDSYVTYLHNFSLRSLQ